MGATGTNTVDFGAFPGTPDTSRAITGQTGIVSGSLVEAWILPATTADHSITEHYVDAPVVMAGEIVAGTGFTVRGFARDGRPSPYGLWNFAWAWV